MVALLDQARRAAISVAAKRLCFYFCRQFAPQYRLSPRMIVSVMRGRRERIRLFVCYQKIVLGWIVLGKSFS